MVEHPNESQNNPGPRPDESPFRRSDLPVLGILSLSTVPFGLLRPPFVDRLQLHVGENEPFEELWVLAEEARHLFLCTGWSNRILLRKLKYFLCCLIDLFLFLV